MLKRRVNVLHLWLLVCQPQRMESHRARMVKDTKAGCFALRLLMCHVFTPTFASGWCLTNSLLYHSCEDFDQNVWHGTGKVQF